MISFIIRKNKAAVYYISQFKLIIETKIKNISFIIVTYVIHLSTSKQKKVAIGTIFHTKGGVYNHIIALNKHIKTSNTTIPPQQLISQFNKEEYYKTYVNLIDHKKIIKNKIIHSHADTWFINYSHEQQSKGSKWIHTYHSLFFKEAYDPLEDWMIEMNEALFHVASKADAKICVSKWLQDYLQTNHQIETIYIPNCADLEKCEKADKTRFIEKYHVEDFILFASSTLYVKNPIEYIRLAEALPQLTFVMIGDQVNRDNLLALYNKELPQNLRVLNDYFHHQDVLDAVAACRVFVMPSLLESLPTAMLEAMALEKPVVATNLYGCKEVLNDGQNGYLYTLGNIDELVEKTLLAYNDHSIGILAKRRVYEHYNWNVVAPQIDEIYSNLLKK